MRRFLSLIVIFVVGGIGGIFLDRFALPGLAATRLGEWIPALRRTSERTVIVNRTEVVKMEEGEAIPELADRLKRVALPVEIVLEKTQRNTTRKAAMPTHLATGLAFTSDGYLLVSTRESASASTTARLAEGEKRTALEFVSASASAHFALYRAPSRNFTALPFEDGSLRIGSRLFTLSARRTGNMVLETFGATMLSAVSPLTFALPPDADSDAIVVNFEGRIVGMSVLGQNGERVFIPAADLKQIGDALLRSAG